MTTLSALPFLPSTADILLWLDAADTRTVDLGSSAVIRWRDKSSRAGHSNSLTGTITWSATGLNGRPCLNFPDASQLQGPLTYAGTQWHAFVVASSGSMSGNGRYLSIGRSGVSDQNDSTSAIVISRHSNNTTVATTRNNISSTTSIPSAGTPFIAQVSGFGTSHFIAVNGSTSEQTMNHGLVAPLNITIWNIGRSPLLTDVGSFLTGSIGEIILFNRQLSILERQTVETYLARKWGITPVLPAGHHNSGAVISNVLQSRGFFTTFSPLSIPNVILWLDAADTAATILSGSTVNVWNDKSGLNFNMNTADSSFPTVGTSINGQRTFNFTKNGGIKQSSTISNTRTFFWVGRQGFQDDVTFLFGHNSTSEWHGDFGSNKFIVDSSASAIEARNATAFLYTDGTNLTNTFGNLNAAAVGNTFLLSVTFNSTTAPMNFQGIAYDRLNTARGYVGDIGEIICYNRQLTATERERIESYLTQKWGLLNTLPVSHLHTTFPAGRSISLPPPPPRFIRQLARILDIIIGNAILGVDYTITNAAGRIFYNFLATGKTMTLRVNNPLVIEYLAIGGGGGGGAWSGGGGGAGGLQQQINHTLLAGTYNVAIGVGGLGAQGEVSQSLNGASTTFGSILTALGGGGGLNVNFGSFTGPVGCGGGRSYVPAGNGQAGTQGFSGGNNINNGATGGGGVSGNGANTTTILPGTAGGPGITYNNGSLLLLGGGGGGGGITSGVAGGTASFGGGAGASGSNTPINGINGTLNTGGGGGGGSGTGNGSGNNGLGGNGGSGILIVSYAV